MQARARASLFKAACMGLFGVAVLARAAWSLSEHGVPAATEMGLVAVVALAANLGVALLLYRYRSGDSNMRSVWICSRNDAIGNIAVMMAALGVFGTGSAWPDLAVAVLMAGLGLWGALTVFKAARGELTMSAAPAEVPDCCAATQEVRVPFVIKRQHGPQ
jgi:Co/Zn/Cd efflux system component